MKNRRSCCCLVVLLVVVLLAALTALLLLWKLHCSRGHNLYSKAAVAADSKECSEIGRDILVAGGSAVDGAIAALLCTSLINPQSMGIGGGSIFTIYDASKGPGTQWIAVPGELRGYKEAHRKFGKLPWKSLFEPSIKLAERGFPIPNYLKSLVTYPFFCEKILNSTLRSLFYHSNGSLLTHVKYPQLAKTLRAIADEGPDIFYSGRIGQDLIADIQKQTVSNS
ncbi:hypothetical protein scyTo_0006340, partial [Scyliorhinus torazame]|nr:hypothetical protein [Scyliorhinus torazame]